MANVDNLATIMTAEQVKSLAKTKEAIALTNDTEVGLAAYFYSRDIGLEFRVTERIETGMVGIGTGVISNKVAPFGNIKQSDMGCEGSKYGMGDYPVIKYLCIGGRA